MSMDFIGKWSLVTPGGKYVGIDTSTGLLNVTSDTQGPDQKFNAYGTPKKFMLQAANGLYLSVCNDGYKADVVRTAATVIYFALEEDPESNSLRVVDLGPLGSGTQDYYWNEKKGALVRIEKAATPPATTQFIQNTLTVGLAEFKQHGFPSPAPDLSYVYLSGCDLSSVDFTEANLQNVTMAEAQLTNVVMNCADLTGADLTSVNLASVSFITATLNGADLSKAKISKIVDFTDADLQNVTMAEAQLTNVLMIGADLTGADLSRADMTGCFLINAVCQKAKFYQTILTKGHINGTDFTGAKLIGANFTQAGVQSVTLIDADLTRAQLSNSDPEHPTIDLSDAKLSSKTKFFRASMKHVNLSNNDLQFIDMAHADLSGAKLDNSKLNHAELSYANLTDATLTGNISMSAANLSNATLTSADLTGAQMGSISLLFRVSDADLYNTFRKSLNTGDVKAVKDIFTDNGWPLQGTVIIDASQYAKGRVWEVKTDQKTYTVRLETVGTTETMGVYETVTAAILTNAFMKGAILTSANLYNVRASGVQLYGGAKLNGNAILEKAQFDNANMSNINLTQAKLNGVNFDYAILTNAKFQGASLSQDAEGGQTSLERTNLQGADFSYADLAEAIFTDAAVSVAQTEEGEAVEGIWLFSIPADEIAVNELNAGARSFSLDAALAPDLKQGLVSDTVRNIFKDKGILLDPQALVAIQATGPYWELVDGGQRYVISEDCDKEKYQPALAVRMEAAQTPLFMLPLDIKKHLKNGAVDPVLNAAFKEKGIDLGSDASVISCLEATDWEIVDTQASYSLWLGLDESCAWQITVRPCLPTLIELFSTYSTPLSRRVTVRLSGNDRWIVDNDSNNPYNAVINYIRFNVVHNLEDKTLDIFGCKMRVHRMVSANKMEYHNITCDLTKLPRERLQDTTVCPNSQRKEFNLSEKIPFKKWMRAKELPKAPSCVPSVDGYYYCP